MENCMIEPPDYECVCGGFGCDACRPEEEINCFQCGATAEQVCEQDCPGPRDIQHEQICESTNAQLLDRLAAIEAGATNWFGQAGYGLDQLSELHAIQSELYCRVKGKRSVPFQTYSLSPIVWAQTARLVRS